MDRFIERAMDSCRRTMRSGEPCAMSGSVPEVVLADSLLLVVAGVVPAVVGMEKVAFPDGCSCASLSSSTEYNDSELVTRRIESLLPRRVRRTRDFFFLPLLVLLLLPRWKPPPPVPVGRSPNGSIPSNESALQLLAVSSSDEYELVLLNVVLLLLLLLARALLALLPMPLTSFR